MGAPSVRTPYVRTPYVRTRRAKTRQQQVHCMTRGIFFSHVLTRGYDVLLSYRDTNTL